MSHLVDCLELEVQVGDEALARQLLNRLSRLHRQSLEELLARVLDQLSPPGSLHRLDRLELDLGEIPEDQLERQFPQRLENALRQALMPRLGTAQEIEAPETSLSSDTPFPSPGGDPPKPVEPRLPSEDRFLPASPEAPGERALAVEPRLPSEDRFLPASPEAPGERALAVEPRLPSEVRLLPASPEAPGERALAVVPRLPSDDRLLPASSEDPGESTLELLAFFAATGTLPWWAPRNDARLIPSAFNAALRLPPEQSAHWRRQLVAAPAARHRLRLALDPAQRLLLSELLAAGAGASLEGPVHPGEREREAPHGVETRSAGERSDGDPPASPSPPPAAALPEARPEVVLPPRSWLGEDLQVDGAGLVLLWPFLETLLDRLEWLSPERQFVGAAQQQRAMALLGFLVDGDPKPPEWRLPLVKLLCGASLESLWGLEGDLSDVEQGEAEKLLGAALAHAEGWLGEEIAVLRGQWLQRPGLLTRRPGAWLLVVQGRDDLDGALEQLPWSCSWIRLPWMTDLIQVAW